MNMQTQGGGNMKWRTCLSCEANLKGLRQRHEPMHVVNTYAY